MLLTHEFHTSFPSPCAPASRPAGGLRPRRDLDALVRRHEARHPERAEVLDPDYIHGGMSLGQMYVALGQRWSERTVFVERLTDRSGGLWGVTLASFEDGVYHVWQNVRDQVPNLELWYEERIEHYGRRVCLQMERDPHVAQMCQHSVFGKDRDIWIACSRARLVELEQSHLGVTRDHDLVDGQDLATHATEILLDSRVNVMSLVGICAVLGV